MNPPEVTAAIQLHVILKLLLWIVQVCIPILVYAHTIVFVFVMLFAAQHVSVAVDLSFIVCFVLIHALFAAVLQYSSF